jgi:general secretion pathway protein J
VPCLTERQTPSDGRSRPAVKTSVVISERCGFTLIELLVVLVVLGFIVTMLAQMLHLGWRSRLADGRAISASTDLESTARLLRELLASMEPGDPADLQGPFVGTRHTVSFVGTLPQGAGATTPQQADIGLGVDSNHRLELRWRPHYRRWIVEPPPPAALVLLGAVERLEMSFLHAASGPVQPAWQSDWSGRDLPALIRIRIIFADGDLRRWPDIIVAPMRTAPRS